MVHDITIGSEDKDLDRISDMVRAQYHTHQALAGRELSHADQYAAGHHFEGIASGATINELIRNPSDSDSYLFIDSRYITTGQFQVQKTLNVDVTGSGTDISVTQRRSDFVDGNNTQASINASVDETVGRSFHPQVIGTGTAGGNTRGAAVPGADVLIAPGDNVFFTATNETTEAQDFTMDIDITEVPVQLVESLE